MEKEPMRPYVPSDPIHAPHVWTGVFPNDRVLEQYKDAIIVESEGNVSVVHHLLGTRYVVDLDDSKRTGKRVMMGLPFDEQWRIARQYIDDHIEYRKAASIIEAEKPAEKYILMVPTLALEKAMASADWYFHRSSDLASWADNELITGPIIQALKMISLDPEGHALANALWDKHLPPEWKKPVSLSGPAPTPWWQDFPDHDIQSSFMQGLEEEFKKISQQSDQHEGRGSRHRHQP